MTTTPSTSPAQTIFGVLGQHLLSDVESPAFGLLGAFLTAVQKNPTTQNVLAQGAILAASAPLQLPNLEQSGISDLASAGQALLALAKQAAGQPTN